MADLLKFVFAIIIVLYHSKNLVEVEGTSIFTLGVISVDFFFLVSGYFLAVGIDKKPYAEGVTLGQDTRNFMLHKICGFLPNYYIAWVIAFLVRHLYRAPYSGSVAVDLLEGIRELNFLEMTGIGEGGYIVNNVTWYLSAMLGTVGTNLKFEPPGAGISNPLQRNDARCGWLQRPLQP